jgi:hypothetical protein
MRTDRAAGGDFVRLLLNGDTTAANYRYARHYAGTWHDDADGDESYIAVSPSASAPADYFCTTRIFIPAYAGSGYKSASSRTDHRQGAAAEVVGQNYVHWESTSAINRIQLEPVYGTVIKAGSRLQVIGTRKLEVVTDVSGSLATTLVASVADVDVQTAGKTTLYTVPAGKVFIPVFVVVRSPSASMAGGTEYDFGSGASCDDWVQDVDLSGLTTPDTDSYIVAGQGAVYPVQTAGAEFGVKVVTGTTAACTATLDVFGYLYDA